MDRLELAIRKFADDVLRACTYYLGEGMQAERAFREVFFKLAKSHRLFTSEDEVRVELFRLCREVCGGNLFRDDINVEYDLYTSYFGLSSYDADYILGIKQQEAYC